MALKDWKKNEYYKGKEYGITNKAIVFSKNDDNIRIDPVIRGEHSGEFWFSFYTPEYKNRFSRFFNTKQQALKFAKAYMRKN